MDIQELGRGMMVPIGTRMEILLGTEVGPILAPGSGDMMGMFGSGGLDNESVIGDDLGI
jgi:hypothetical protein